MPQMLFSIAPDSIAGPSLSALPVTPVPRRPILNVDPDGQTNLWAIQRIGASDYYRVSGFSDDLSVTLAVETQPHTIQLQPDYTLHPPPSLPPGFAALEQFWFLKAAQNVGVLPSFQFISAAAAQALAHGLNLFGDATTVGPAQPDQPDSSLSGTYWLINPASALQSVAVQLQVTTKAWVGGGTQFIVTPSIPAGIGKASDFRCTIAGTAPTGDGTPKLMSLLDPDPSLQADTFFYYEAAQGEFGPAGTLVTVVLEDADQYMSAVSQGVVPQ